MVDSTYDNRASLAHQVRYAMRHPDRIAPHLRRLARDLRLRWGADNHVAYYRAVMRADTARSPEAAVGSPTHKQWLALGKMQFDYLLGHGLTPGDRMLEIGCGNLRAGWHFIDYLEPGHYHGIDISPEILTAAQDTLVHHGLQAKLANLALVSNLRLAFLPDAYFTVVHAHSVFSHSPIEVINECLSHVGRVLASKGIFDFTFNRAAGVEHHILREDFYYRTETLLDLAERHGLTARFMDDWEQLPHRQSKIRLTRGGSLPACAAQGQETPWGDYW